MGGTHTINERKNACKILDRNPKGKIPQRRPRHRWEDYIRLDLRDKVWEGVN